MHIVISSLGNLSITLWKRNSRIFYGWNVESGDLAPVSCLLQEIKYRILESLSLYRATFIREEGITKIGAMIDYFSLLGQRSVDHFDFANIHTRVNFFE